MPKTNVTFLLDRSGSMDMILDDTIGAFNAYLNGLTAPDMLFSLVQFDTMGLDKVCVRVSPAQAPRLDKTNFVPRGGTPLIDASYKTIKAVEASLNGDAETQVVICIQTDGHENSSREYTMEQLSDLIKEKTALGWQFNFMGASIDAYDQAGQMGISAAMTVSYNAQDQAATMDSFASLASNTKAFAAGLASNTAYSAGQKRAAGDIYDPDLKGPAPYVKTAPAATPRPPYVKPTITQVPKPRTRQPAVDDFKL